MLQKCIGILILIFLIFTLFYIFFKNIYKLYIHLVMDFVLDGKKTGKPSLDLHFRKTTDKHIEKYGTKKQKEQAYEQMLADNREHLPPAKLPPLTLNLDMLDDFIKETHLLTISDEGERFSYYKYVPFEPFHHPRYKGAYKKEYISKSDFDADTRKFFELLYSDLSWFYSHPTAHSLAERSGLMKTFLQNKYDVLGEESITQIVSRYDRSQLF